ncbi:hypothetical protein [Virgibacillus salexigens]|uniref:Uncharacterized protein n=1 Tax=Virgibacillus kapii TaxID=1638645 RepID=A0ABQ2DH02_9BACI|nr:MULTISPECIES: hypothetical protein [Virgibacillus]MYL43919.1 hypothetical protein [Virgibacillus massiliensis]GGJ57384.1 hypothetical protein GCM10007111_19460 [Virgibacillus kapii]
MEIICLLATAGTWANVNGTITALATLIGPTLAVWFEYKLRRKNNNE